jgi:hypothetical protein
MTESEWASCTDPTPMLKFLRARGKLSDRKARLFAVACCRRIWGLLGHGRSRRAVEVAERNADQGATAEELEEVRRGANRVYAKAFTNPAAAYAPLVAASRDAMTAASLTAHWAATAAEDPLDVVGLEQVALLRDILGNAFHAVTADPALLAWNNGTVRRLAEAAYNERQLPGGTLDVARLAVLADALEEAGCCDAGLLGHLRSAGRHWRGCWALDALLGKS